LASLFIQVRPPEGDSMNFPIHAQGFTLNAFPVSRQQPLVAESE
jgi:hypothetical protein